MLQVQRQRPVALGEVSGDRDPVRIEFPLVRSADAGDHHLDSRALQGYGTNRYTLTALVDAVEGAFERAAVAFRDLDYRPQFPAGLQGSLPDAGQVLGEKNAAGQRGET